MLITCNNYTVLVFKLGELSSIQSSRAVSPVHSISPEADIAGRHSSISSAEPRTPSPDRDEPWIMFTRHRTQSDAQYEHTEVHDGLFEILTRNNQQIFEFFKNSQSTQFI